MRKNLAGLVSGLIFGVGLVVSGMTQPSKVLSFLDVTGAWDPSLGLVMAGAIAVYAPVYRFVFLRSPQLMAASSLSLVPAPRERIDARLVIGAAIFGVGWGLGGFCPGPGIVALATAALPAIVFSSTMLAGMFAFRVYEARSR